MASERLTDDLREVVLDALERLRRTGARLNDVLPTLFETHALPSRLRGAASELASGIVRRRITLDGIVRAFADRALRSINPTLLDVLRLGVYEILFVEEIPTHAAVDEAVNLAKRRMRRAKRASSGFVNAILRALVRALDEDRSVPGGLSAGAVEVAPGRFVAFTRDLFPDPVKDPVGYLATAGGMPHWLAERWVRHFGTDAAFRLVSASNNRPPVSIRVNTLRTSPEVLVAAFDALGIKTSVGEVEGHIRVESPVALTSLEAFADGWFYIQDASAMHAPLWCAPKAGERVLDLCAAPGGKTTHLAALANDRAGIVALDVSARRLARVDENARRLGITGIRTRVGDARHLDDDFARAFDVVLADVPCSNTGVLRRRVEARHRLAPASIEALVAVQADVLASALDACRAGGRVVYSTCSIECEENGELVRRVLAERTDARLDDEMTMLSDARGADGGYVARLIRE